MPFLRGLGLFLLFLSGGGRRTIRIGDSHHNEQHKQKNTLANGLQLSAEAQEALIPGGFGTRVLSHASPQTADLEPHRAAPSFRFGPGRAKVALQGARGSEEDQMRPTAVGPSVPQLDRRSVIQGAAVAASARGTLPVSAAGESKEAKQVRDTLADLKIVIDKKDAFMAGLITGDETAPQLPPAIPFKVFQKLESTSGPDFMEPAIDYAEAFRGAKDLVKLAKLTKQKVQVSKKEPGKPTTYEEMEYGQAPGSNLGSAQEYAERASQEVLGAYLALEAATKAMGK